MKKNRKGGFRHPEQNTSKGITYLSDLQVFGNEITDDENQQAENESRDSKACFRESLTVSKREIYDKGTPKSILGKDLTAFQGNIIFSLQKCPKTVRDLAREFSLDPSSIRQFLKRLIRQGIVSRVWRAYDLSSDREAYYYSSDTDMIEFSRARKEAGNGRLH